jgi:hypothetical protein
MYLYMSSLELLYASCARVIETLMLFVVRFYEHFVRYSLCQNGFISFKKYAFVRAYKCVASHLTRTSLPHCASWIRNGATAVGVMAIYYILIVLSLCQKAVVAQKQIIMNELTESDEKTACRPRRRHTTSIGRGITTPSNHIIRLDVSV